MNKKNSYLKLMVDYKKMTETMAQVATSRGGDVEGMFGSWDTWGDTFALRDAQVIVVCLTP